MAGCPNCGFVGDRETGEVFDTTFPCPRCGQGGAVVTADLNPPLGNPGGPCQVVNRILKRVQDKHLQKGLVDEVQKGDDLSNAEASKVYPIEAEPGVGPIHRITITSHGQYRMDLRGITVDDVQAALGSFVKQLAAWKALKSPAYDTFAGRLEGKEHVEWVDPRSKLKVVFAQEAPGTVRLITTFWRGQQTAPPPRGLCPVPRKAAMDPLLLRIVARYQRQALDAGPWLPDLLGSKAHLVDEILKAAKRMADEDTWKKGDIKSICGGVCYFLVQIEAGRSVAQKLWNLLDASGGLDAGNKVEGLAHRVSNHLDGGAKSKVQAAAIGVALLQRSKQPTKAQRVNAILVDALKLDIDMHGDPGEKSKPQSARVAFAEMVKEQLPLARVVWGQVKDVPTAATIAWEVLEDVNAHDMASTAEGILSALVKGEVPQDVVREHVGQVSGAIHWGIEPAAAFGVAIMEVAGQGAAARRLFSALLKDVAEFLGPGTMFD